MKEITFTEMQEDDLPVVLNIYNHYIVTTTVMFDSDPISIKTLKTRICIDHDLYKAYLIHHAGEIAGFCFPNQFNKHESYNGTAELGLYFKSQHTRQVVGTRTVRHLQQIAAAKGLTMVWRKS